MTKISVLVPAYNAIANYPRHMFFENMVHTLAEEREGVDIELCIVDDHSSDDTWSTMGWVLGQFGGIMQRHSINQGVAGSLNTCLSVATGDYVVTQSVRSHYKRGSLARMAQALDEHPEVGFVYGSTRYTGVQNTVHVPPVFNRESFKRNFHSLFGYMFRSSARSLGCQFSPYITREGKHIDISDYDFVMQLIFDCKWDGLALRDLETLQYYYSGQGQMTQLVHKYQADIDAEFHRRWDNA